jgi:hypothetical protein
MPPKIWNLVPSFAYLSEWPSDSTIYLYDSAL